jgi:hypothetical protein
LFAAFSPPAFILALFGIYRALRRDHLLDRRVDAFTGRVDLVERRLSRYQQRVYQLEAILRERGIDVPPWTLNPDDIDELGASQPQGERT